jgi:hypothetical protein
MSNTISLDIIIKKLENVKYSHCLIKNLDEKGGVASNKNLDEKK